VAGVVVVLDRFSKIYIMGVLDPGESVPIVRGILDLTHVRNPGAIFGLFGSLNSFLIPIGLLVILAILYYSFRIRPKDRLLDLALALELGGATGNLIDRLAYGRVIDFIDFKVWPVFNVADSAITLGLFFLGLYLFSQIKRTKEVG
jgi:signal peptidase II